MAYMITARGDRQTDPFLVKKTFAISIRRTDLQSLSNLVDQVALSI